jgi:hypothetical protein
VIRASRADAGNNTPANRFAVKAMSRVLGVLRSGCHDWRVREPAARTSENARLATRIKAIHATGDEVYCARKIYAELRDIEVADHDPRWANVGKNRVARLVHASGIRGVSRRRSFTVATERNKKDPPGPGSDQTRVRGRCAQQAVGGRYHLRIDVGRCITLLWRSPTTCMRRTHATLNCPLSRGKFGVAVPTC